MLVHCRSLPSNLIGFPQQFAGTHSYTWEERGTVRVKYLVQEHNTMSPGQNKYFFKKIQMVCYLSYATSCQHFGCNTTNSTNTHNHHCVVTNSLVRKFKFEKRIKYCFLNKQHLDIKHHVLRQSLCSSLVVTQAGTVFVWWSGLEYVYVAGQNEIHLSLNLNYSKIMNNQD